MFSWISHNNLVKTFYLITPFILGHIDLIVGV